MKRSLTGPGVRPLAAGVIVAGMLSAGLVAVSSTTAQADGTNSAIVVDRGLTDPVNIQSSVVTFRGTAASEIEQVVLHIDNMDDDLPPVERVMTMGTLAGVSPDSVVEQTWSKNVDFLTLVDHGDLTDGGVAVSVSFSDIVGVVGDPEVFPLYVDVHAPRITSSQTSGELPVGTSVELSVDSDFLGMALPVATFTVDGSQPDAGSAPVGEGVTHVVTKDTQIKVYAMDAAGNESSRSLNYTVPRVVEPTPTPTPTPDPTTTTPAPTATTPAPAATTPAPAVTTPAPAATTPTPQPPIVATGPGTAESASVVRLKVKRVSPRGREFVVLKNTGQVAVDLAGYRLRDRVGHRLVLPSYELDPGAKVKVYTGRGTSKVGKLFVGKRASFNIWNKSDTAKLYGSDRRWLSQLRY